MNSFTSSSNPRLNQGLRLVFLFMGAILLGGFSKNYIENARREPEGLHPIPRSFWVRKAFLKGDYDVVVAGDSRTYCGIVPSVIEDTGNGMRVLNLGYPLVGWTKEYCQLIEEKLSEEGLRVIVLGLSPHSFIQSAQANPSLRRYIDASLLESWLSIRLPSLVEWFQPIKMTDMPFWLLKRGPFGAPTPEKQFELQIPHQDGWIESWSDAASVEGNVKFYTRIFQSEQISHDILEFMCATISGWRMRGIKVFCVRIPVSPEVENVEGSLPGFDDTTVSLALTAAGAIWVDVPDRTTYHSYDGSHLFREDARRISKLIATKIFEARKVK